MNCARISTVLAALVMSAGAAQAADLIIDNSALEMASPVGMDWSGAYVGAHAGFASGTVDWEVTGGGPSGSYDLDGWLLGGQIGYNWQMDSIVYGLEADLSLTDINGSDEDILASRTLDWMASVRGRIGYALDGILLYGTAGLALAKSTGEVFIADDTQTHVGWTAGLGVEVMVSDNVSLRGEYRYTGFAAENYDYSFTDSDTSFSAHSATVGLNYHF